MDELLSVVQENQQQSTPQKPQFPEPTSEAQRRAQRIASRYEEPDYTGMSTDEMLLKMMGEPRFLVDLADGKGPQYHNLLSIYGIAKNGLSKRTPEETKKLVEELMKAARPNSEEE